MAYDRVYTKNEATITESVASRDVNFTITGATAEIVAAAVAEYEQQWPRWGYSTNVTKPGPQADGSFAATGWRSKTCD